MNIVLIGYRCSGKTAVGRILAKKLKRKFIDSDAYLERKFGTTISQIFKMRGEPYFRLLESDVINEVSKFDDTIMATGGGAVLKYKNMRNLKRAGIIVFLDVNSQNSYKRLLKDKTGRRRRPKLTDKDISAEIKEQIEFRQPYYERFADYAINTNNKSAHSVAKNVLRILKDYDFE